MFALPKSALAAAWFFAGLAFFASAAQGGFESAYSLALSAAATSLGLICWALGGATLSAEPPARRLGWVPSGLPASVLAGLVLGLLAVSQLTEVAIAELGFAEVGVLPQIRQTLTGISSLELFVAFVGLGLFPGFGEELALRGWVQRGLEPRVGAVAAVGGTSLLFGLMHGDAIHAVGAAVLGIYLGAIVALTGSIRPAVLCHMVNNLVATAGTALALDQAAQGIFVLGLFAGPWAFWRTVLHRRAAHSPLKETPEPPSPSGPNRSS